MASTSAGGSGTGRGAPPPKARLPELEDPLNLYLFHPLAHRLATVLRPTGVSPNAVSAASGLCVAIAAGAYTMLGWPLSVLLGFAFHMLWHVVDGADGDLARLTGKTSPAGELVDGVCDYAGHAIMYVALAAFLDDWLGIWAWGLSTLSAFSRIAQSNHVETQRRVYQWRVHSVPWLKQAQSADDPLFRRKGLIATIFVSWFARGYIKLASATNPHSTEIDEALARSAGDVSAARRLRRLCRSSSRGSLVYQHLLGANPRTILLAISMALGSPLWFFIVETTLLNLLLASSIAHQRRCNRIVVARLPDARAPPGHG
jgi:hypothetical protein